MRRLAIDLQVDELQVWHRAAQAVAMRVWECRGGKNRALGPPCQFHPEPVEPLGAIGIAERNSGPHLGQGLRRMKCIALDKCQTRLRGNCGAEARFAATGYPHDHDPSHWS